MALIIRNVRNQQGGGDTMEANTTAVTLDGESLSHEGPKTQVPGGVRDYAYGMQ